MLEYNRPIPECGEPEQKGTIQAVSEPLIDLGAAGIEKMVMEPRYYLNGLEGAIPKIYVRKQVASMLEKAASLLPKDHRLKIYDGWRPYCVQEVLYRNYYDQLKRENQELSADQLEKKVRAFASYPSKDPMQPFVHSTGGAVDLTIIDGNNEELEMGSFFDDFSEKSHTRYFEDFASSKTAENRTNMKIAENRRLLYHVMTDAGFTNLPTEWWHYDYGDDFWAFYKKTDAIYTGIYEIKFEQGE